MDTFDFIITASGTDPEGDFETRFFNAGCSDATISFGNGRITLDFSREAESFRDALSSAINDVIAAGATITQVRLS